MGLRVHGPKLQNDVLRRRLCAFFLKQDLRFGLEHNCAPDCVLVLVLTSIICRHCPVIWRGVHDKYDWPTFLMLNSQFGQNPEFWTTAEFLPIHVGDLNELSVKVVYMYFSRCANQATLCLGLRFLEGIAPCVLVEVLIFYPSWVIAPTLELEELR